MKQWIQIAIFLCSSIFAGAQKNALDASLLHRAQHALTGVIVHDIFAPPVASRIYLYANMAAYEAALPAQKVYSSLRQSLPMFPRIQPSGRDAAIRYDLSAVYAFLQTARRFVFSEAILNDSLQSLLKAYDGVEPAVYQASLAYGQSVADSIMAWADKDGYRESRKLRRYNLLKAEGKWLPTAPGYMAAVEPNWSRMRPVALDSSAECKPVPPPPFSVQKESAFYRQALEVYSVHKNMTNEQREIALFWDCNPFFLNVQGHLNFATKKLSPGGHWMSIAGIAARKKGADLNKSAAAYLLTAIALYDGFISCWDEKYRSNLVRPETYINSYIDEQWRPLLQTPPFPEYTSGHSVISTAAALVLTHFFGENFSFDDNTETPYGLPVRTFPSFKSAAEEAAVSRLYGGIHYKAAIENGQVQGRKVGEKVLRKIRLTTQHAFASQ
ncbi:MAG: vanadium-dependent haloperoxidase [Bacteroidota bacterium]|nr:vanadium-dependent haloperoxidase [Bacteroidota bacterium]